MYYVLNIAGLSLFLYRNGILAHEAGTWLQAVHQILVLELAVVLSPVVKTNREPRCRVSGSPSFLRPSCSQEP